jgi:hypothetical protein
LGDSPGLFKRAFEEYKFSGGKFGSLNGKFVGFIPAYVDDFVCLLFCYLFEACREEVLVYYCLFVFQHFEDCWSQIFVRWNDVEPRISLEFLQGLFLVEGQVPCGVYVSVEEFCILSSEVVDF